MQCAFLLTKFSSNVYHYSLSGVFPYSYLTPEDRFEEGLPGIDAFYNDLNDRTCSPEDYQHVKNFWEKCNIHNLGN